MNWATAVAIEDARRAGFDMDLMEELLALTPEERVLRHDAEMKKLLELERVARERRVITVGKRRRVG